MEVKPATKPSAQSMTLDQRRAQDAWQKSASYNSNEYVNFVKGMPTLIMNSGLMQTLAYCHEKKKEAEKVASDLRHWLAVTTIGSDDAQEFNRFMEHLLHASSAEYQELTTEAMAWLRWMRQIAATRLQDRGEPQ